MVLLSKTDFTEEKCLLDHLVRNGMALCAQWPRWRASCVALGVVVPNHLATKATREGQ